MVLLPDTVSGTIPEFVFVTFQLTFAALTPALIVGGFAERIKFSGMLLFMTGWFTIVYLPICHMVWGGGLIAEMGAIDFAGGTVVHINAGIAALVLALLIGPRIGFGKEPNASTQYANDVDWRCLTLGRLVWFQCW
jgi:Amt family ammonium transporter